eukprot:a680067_7.p1 GENE.a680067_7~~a680067_7.p1  ORF type:complete len:408 (-),score=158.33 a680067_7:21-1217(-)
MADNEVCILGAARTPTGAFMGSLAELSAPQLGGIAIKAALEQAGVAADAVDDVVLGHVLSAAVGQAPASQAASAAGVSARANCSCVNKVCASGLKALMVAAQGVALGLSTVAVAGGMESMSNAPHALKKSRSGIRYGAAELVDTCQIDGLTDAGSGDPMGLAGELCAATYGVSRADQDAYARGTFERAIAATGAGMFADEIAAVTLKTKSGTTTVVADEGIAKFAPDKMASLKPAFKADGTVTAANSSPLSDGASALVLTTAAHARELGRTPLATIVSYADASQAPMEFTTSPARAIPIALARAGLGVGDISLWEINEAFAVVALVNASLLGIDPSKVNVNGGAVALGHALGSSGSRIVVTLVHSLRRLRATVAGPVYGVAAVCNGGGGASAVVIRVE